jgi:arsenate reductase
MEIENAVSGLGALAHRGRLEIFRLLVRAGPSGVPAGEIASATQSPLSTLSTNLNVLRDAGLVASRREGRSIIYTVAYDRMSDLLAFLMEDCCAGDSAICGPLVGIATRAAACCEPSWEAPMPARNVLFLCTGNSARSIIAEALMNRLGAGRFVAYSAGSMPKGDVNPHTLALLESKGFSTKGFRSKSWEEFAREGAPEMNLVFTVCDNAANDVCPIWPGHPVTAHWGIPDPAAVEGSEAEIGVAFADAYRQLERRISLFLNLPIESLDRMALQRRLDDIGHTDDAAQPA